MNRRTFLIASCALTLPEWGRALVKPGVLSEYSQTYGEMAVRRLNAWQQLMDDISGQQESTRLAQANKFFNQLRFIDDDEQWGSRDYWATPLEFLGRGAGDCEEFAIAKYVTLVKTGTPTSQLRITYVKALELNQAHMVLTWVERAGDEPLVLDNLIPQIRPASQRRDLLPVYSFNADSLWLTQGSGEKLVSDSSRVGRWQDLRQRMSREIAL